MARKVTLAALPLPPAEDLHKRFRYDPNTGALEYYRPAGTVQTQADGYKTVAVVYKGQAYKAHRLAWKMYYGTEPPPIIDHINGDSTDNRISNLRAASSASNCHNAKIRRNNTTSVTGVKFHKQSGKFTAQISVRGDYLYLGLFPTIAEAAAVRRAAEIQHHGEFAGINREA